MSSNPQTQPFIFLSYAHDNEKIVRRLVSDLQKQGISVWIDQQNLQPGTPDWELAIRSAISTATALVLVTSPQARKSRVVRGELAVAKNCQCPIYPFWIQGEKWIDCIPIEFSVRQYIDARGSSYKKGFSSLVETLQRILPVSQKQPSSPSGQTLPDPLQNLDSKKIATTSHSDWGDAPDVPVFFGRSDELNQLKRWITKEHQRLVAIVGMPGIGKTDLSVRLGKGGIGKTDLTIKLTRGIQHQFEYVIWRRLLNAPKLTDIIADFIKVLSNQQDIDLPLAIDDQISKLIAYLQQHRCLLVLDNAETILEGGHRAGQYREGYDDYGQLFRKIAEVPHKSCLLLTSREKPEDIAQLEGPMHMVRFLELKGLDYASSKQIFEVEAKFHQEEYHQTGFSGSEEAWQELTEFYSGNPLALALAAKHILNFYGGDIATFLKDGKQLFSDLRGLLDWYFTRLDDYEKEVMYWLAIDREPMSITDLQEDILSPKSKAAVFNTLHLLQRLIPLDRSANRFTLQPVLMEYMTEQLVEQAITEFEQKYIDVLNKYALLKAHAKDYIRESQIRLIIQPILRHFMTNGKASCETQLKNMLALLRTNPPIYSGYATSNILNSLIIINADLHGMDFSHLTIRQAYLREATLIDVNFAHADLAKSVFTDIFGSILSVAFNQQGTQVAAGTDTGDIRVWQVSNGTPLYTFSGHTDWVWGLAYSPNGSLLASGSSDQTIRLWDVANEQCIHTLRGHTHRIRNVTFSKDGLMLASASEDKTVRIWDVNSGKSLYTLAGHTNPVRAIAFTPDSETLVSGSDDHTVRIWDIKTQICRNILKGHSSQIWSLALSSDGNIIASGGDDRTVRTWDIHTGQCLKILQGHTNWICSLAFAPNSTTLASGSADNTVRIWDVGTGQPLNILQGHKNWVNSVNFSADGKTLASGSHDQTIHLWETSTGHSLMTLQGYSSWVRSVAFSSKGLPLASGDRTVHLWNPQTGQSITTLQGHTSWVRTLAFTTDGALLASGSDDQTARIWKVRTAQPLWILRGHTNRVKTLAFSHDGKFLVTGSDDHTVRLWDVHSGRHRRILRGHTNRIRSVAFNTNNVNFASGSDDWTARIWDIYNDQPIHILEGHTNRVWSIAFSPDGQLLATGSEDATIRLWDISTGQCLHTLQGHTNPVWSIAFSPDGQTIASSSEDRTVRVWYPSTGQCLHILTGHTNTIWTVAFSHNSKLLASGSHDHTVRLWDSHSGTNITVLHGHSEPIWALAFSPDNSTVVSCSDDGTCILWDIQQNTSKYILKSEYPYERMNITEVEGLSESQKAILRALGAYEEEKNIV